MLYLVFQKEVKKIKDEYTVSYYIETYRRKISTIYEFVGLYRYDFRRYHIELFNNLVHEGIIISNIIKNFEKVYNGFNQRRKLAVFSKFVLYIISKELNIPLYRLVKNVSYEENGEIVYLSPHAFINSVYNLSNLFEKILS